MSERYNGWTNYETWRINLELFDGLDASDYIDEDDVTEDKDDAERQLAAILEEMADEMIREECPSERGLAYDLAQSFLQKVNWREIAEHKIDDMAE